MTIMNSITVAPIPTDLLIDLARSMDALRELSALTPIDDPNHRLLELVSSDLTDSCKSLFDHFQV